MLRPSVRTRLLIESLVWRMQLWWAGPLPDRMYRPPSLRPGLVLGRMNQIPLATALNNAHQRLFPYARRHAHYILVETETSEARALCEDILKAGREVYGIGDDFIGFLQQQSGKLLKDDIAYVNLRWKVEPSNHTGDDPDTAIVPILPLLVPFNSGGVRPIYRAGGTRYRVTPSRAHWWGSATDVTGKPPYIVPSEEMAIFAAPDYRAGEPPLARFVDDYRRDEVAGQQSLTAMYAIANPNDRRMRVEAARHRPGDTAALLRARELASLRLYDGAGASLLEYARIWTTTEPKLTEYYLGWQHIDSRKRLTRLRDATLDQFARQVLEPALVRNGLAGPVKLRADHFPTEGELDELFGQYERGEISIEDLWKRTDPRMPI